MQKEKDHRAVLSPERAASDRLTLTFLNTHKEIIWMHFAALISEVLHLDLHD